jgi:GH15 family glucan-1,4-alpha-glucosidase
MWDDPVMRMSRSSLFRSLVAVAALGAIAVAPTSAHAWWRGGVVFGFGPWLPYAYPYPYPYYYPPPVVYAPPPVVYGAPPPPPASAAQPPVASGAAPAAGPSSCYAGQYVCPLAHSSPVGAPCSCPTNDNGRGGGGGRRQWIVTSDTADFLGGGPAPIEDYALIGDCTTAALVSRAGSIDWLCWPRFDSPACFAALLGTPRHGCWRIAPADPAARVTRRYRDGTLVLETLFATATGEVAVTDFMPVGVAASSVIRSVTGVRGSVDMRMALALRFYYGTVIPWVTHLPDGGGIRAIAGPDMVVLRSPAPLDGEDLHTVSRFRVHEGQSVAFVLSHCPSHLPQPEPLDAAACLERTTRHWTDWTARGSYRGPYEAAVQRSLITLKALTYAPTGGIVAAPTTSLPEHLGGTRNWDYRYCWLRDATLTLLAFMHAGYYEEAQAWRDWLLRSVAGTPDTLQIMYGLAGERRLREWEADWLPGYQGAKPVRIGNAAHNQVQLDVFGEVMDALHHARAGGMPGPTASWDLQRNMIDHLEQIWRLPDEGIWETRGGRQCFTFSRVMAWVAVDRAIRSAEQFGLPGPLDQWRALRDEMHATICRDGFDVERNSFVQSFGGKQLDASCLMIALVGFLPADDPRLLGTVAAIERELMSDGFTLRYRTEAGADGLPPGEGVFLACSFWLADNYVLQGRTRDARDLFNRLLSLRNDVGLLAEEYDPVARRQVGNFPQAFSHLALIGTAMALARGEAGPVETRAAPAETT